MFQANLIPACKAVFPEFIQGMSSDTCKKHVLQHNPELDNFYSMSTDISAFDSGRNVEIFGCVDQPLFKRLSRTIYNWCVQLGAKNPDRLSQNIVDQGIVRGCSFIIMNRQQGKTRKICRIDALSQQGSGRPNTTLCNTIS